MMSESQGDQAQSLKSPVSTDPSSSPASVPSLPNQQQTVSQEGNTNLVLGDHAADVQVGDRNINYGLSADDFRTMMQALEPFLSHVPPSERPTAVLEDLPLAVLTFETQLADRINSRLTTLEELKKSGQLAKEQIALLNQVKGKVRSIMEMQQELEAIAANADQLLKDAIDDLTEKLRELERSQVDSYLEARSQACLQEQLDVLQKFQAELADGKVVAYWLNRERTKDLAQRLGEHALALTPEVKASLSEKQVDAFYFSIDLFLERLCQCLTWGRNNSLNTSVIARVLQADIYAIAFEKIKTEIPVHLPASGISQLVDYTDYLIQRLPSYDYIEIS